MGLLSSIAIILYLAATVLLALKFYRPQTPADKLKIAFNTTGLIALLLHAQLLYTLIVIDHGLDFSFFNAVSLIGWLVALIVMVTSLFRPLENLLLMLFPIAAITIFLEIVIPGERLLTDSLSM